MRNRLDAAVEETLATLFHRGDSGEKREPRRLQLVAFKENGGAVLELIASSREEQNLQDRIALLGRYAEGPEGEREISLRLLRHVASSIRHQQYHDTDIVTIRVKAPEPEADQPSENGSGKAE